MTEAAALVHGLCGFEVLPGGELVPSLSAGVPDEGLLEGRRLVLHVFASSPEAAAFAAGVALAARNDVRAVAGRDGAELIVAIDATQADRRAPERFEDAVEVVDRGGAAAQTARAMWQMLRTGMPEGFVLDIAPDGSSVELDIGPRRFALSLAYGEVTATTTYLANAKRVSTALACNWTTSAVDFDAIDKTLQVRFPVETFREKVGVLTLVDTLVADEESRDEFGLMRERIRTDPGHCRIVELMLQGWRMSSFHGSVVMIPPADSGARLRPLAGALLQRLIAADLVRKPRSALHRNELHNFAYEVGSLSGSAVRIPEKGTVA